MLLRRAWDSGWASLPSLDPDLLIRKAAAHAETGPDHDLVGWRGRLDHLCADLQEHAQLSELGRTLAHGQLVSALSSRFRAHAMWRRHPEIADRPVSAPILIVGQMRSGTTRMQRLLACDPRLTFTRFFESWNPVPASGWHTGLGDRELKGWFALACAQVLNPCFGSIHPTAWHAPDEEIGLHNLSIFGSAFEAQWRVPNFTAAVENEDSTGVYREFKLMLQTLSWLRRDDADRPWILKVPQFAQDMPALLQAFPDARVIFLHRDPLDVVASSSSLVCNQMMLQSDSTDPHWIGREWSRKVRLREARMAAAKTSAAVAQIEVRYEDVTRDWAGEMQRVYHLLRMPLGADVHAAMSAYSLASAPARRKRHLYDPERFGLAEAPAGMALA